MTIATRLKSMPTGPWNVVYQHLRADPGPGGDGPTDGELVTRFLKSRGEDALAALVRRHASMVWGVCSRTLRSHHDAEDAFQATFLVLVCKAAVVPGHAVANWLYGVARQTAVRARATAAKQVRRETHVVDMPEPTMPEVRDADLQAVVDEELSRLPDHYRGVVVLCDLEEMTRLEAARQLGIPEGSVASRLARARALLAKRLVKRGVVFSGNSLAALLSAGSASSSALPALVASTIKAASLLAAGQAAGFVTALTDGVVKAMFMTKIKSVLTVALVVGLALGGIGLVVGLSTNPVAVAQAETPKEAPVKKESPATPVAATKEEKPPHIVEKADKKRTVGSNIPYKFGEKLEAEQLLVVSKQFMSLIRHPDHEDRFRDYFDPRYLKKYELTDRDIAFESVNSLRILRIDVADDVQTVLCLIELPGDKKQKEAIILRWVVYEGYLYLSPEKAPDPKTGIFKPWILRTKVN